MSSDQDAGRMGTNVQAQMVELFGWRPSVIARHIGNVFAEGELPREGSMQIVHRTPDGGRPATFYNLDLIISVGYLVKSKRGTQFRIWATSVLRDHTYAALDHRTVSPPRKPAARASRPKPEAAETGWGGASV